MVQALALDVGSSQIKVGVLNEEGHIELQYHEPAPLLKGRKGARVTHPSSYLEKATHLLSKANASKDTPLGISCQRSSFVIWDVRSGKTLTPLISWQDLRSDAWVQKNQHLAEEVFALTGLPLSAHYVAAKLAWLFEENPRWRERAERGQLRFGTLETYLIWHWTDRTRNHTDMSMAARTQLMDLTTHTWSPRLLELFQIPDKILPNIARERTRITIPGYVIHATMADQAACTLPIFHGDTKTTYVNAGTATFLMRNRNDMARKGLLTALLPKTPKRDATLIWEAPINAGARILRGFRLPTEIIRGSQDPLPDCFAIADGAGLGAPHWRPDLSSKLSDKAQSLGFKDRQLIYFEGLLFRVREVLEALCKDQKPTRIVLSGGLSARFDFTQLLAALLDAPLFVLKEREMSLWGAAWVATGCGSEPNFQEKQVHTKFAGTYLTEKYFKWKAWMDGLVK